MRRRRRDAYVQPRAPVRKAKLADNVGRMAGGVATFTIEDDRIEAEAWDKLSPRLRERIANAPYAFSAAEILGMVEAMGEPEAFRRFSANIPRIQAMQVLNSYGPTHPQAPPVRQRSVLDFED